jgi:hypothetical protein
VGVHRLKLPGGVHVQERKGRWCRMEGLAGQVQHHRGVLADRVEHHGLAGTRDRFSEDLDGFGFQLLEVIHAVKKLGGHSGQ